MLVNGVNVLVNGVNQGGAMCSEARKSLYKSISYAQISAVIYINPYLDILNFMPSMKVLTSLIADYNIMIARTIPA